MPETPKSMRGSALLKGTLIAALLLYGGLLGSLFVPSVGMIAFISALCVSYLWAYAGSVLGTVVFLASWLAGRRAFPKKRQRLQFSVQLSAVTFAMVGIILMAAALSLPGYNIHMAGYWLHVKLWLDVDKVRNWAQSLGIRQDPRAIDTFGVPVAYERWPATLRILSVPAGRVYVNRRTIGVTVEHGSPLLSGCYLGTPYSILYLGTPYSIRRRNK
jgi:hypothetical protein